jgi:hypothetical protein
MGTPTLTVVEAAEVGRGWSRGRVLLGRGTELVVPHQCCLGRGLAAATIGGVERCRVGEAVVNRAWSVGNPPNVLASLRHSEIDIK